MQYTKTLTTKTGSELYLRNGDAPDGDAALAVFNKTHAETEYLLTYPDESSMTAEQEAEFLAQATKSAREIEILAFVDGSWPGRRASARWGSRASWCTVRNLASAFCRHTGGRGSAMP